MPSASRTNRIATMLRRNANRIGQGPTGDYNVTKYDPDSIMNYCNPHWNGDGKLSTLDIEAVQKFYGN